LYYVDGKKKEADTTKEVYQREDNENKKDKEKPKKNTINLLLCLWFQ